MDQTSQAELQGLGQSSQSMDDTEPITTTSLPPVDGGFAAWLFLAGGFTIEMLLWGEFHGRCPVRRLSDE